jgi:hypothetical protein
MFEKEIDDVHGQDTSRSYEINNKKIKKKSPAEASAT